MKLFNLYLPNENELTNEMLPDVNIQVLTGTKHFVAALKGKHFKCTIISPDNVKLFGCTTFFSAIF